MRVCCGKGAAPTIVSMVVGILSAGCGKSGAALQASDGGPDGSQRPLAAVPLFDETTVHQLSLTMSADDWQSIIDDSRGDEWRHASVTYDGVTVDDVGVRPSGESSRFAGNQKMSFRIKFDAFAGHGAFGGTSDVNVKGEFDDGSMMRERLALFVFNALMPAPKVAHARLVVNGDLRGLFTLREDWHETSIAAHFSSPVGPLYRIRPALHTDDPYTYRGDDPARYVPLPWQQHVGKPAVGDEVIAPFLQRLASDPAALEQVADVDDLFAYLAAFALIMDTDGLVGSSGVADHFQYYDPTSKKFVVLPWDPDNTFGSQGEMPNRWIYEAFDQNALTVIVHNRSDLRARYEAKIADAMAAVPVAAVQAEADAIYSQIRDVAHEDPIKMFPNQTVDWNVGYVKDFVAARYANLNQQLAKGP